jgi:hypothetical protein
MLLVETTTTKQMVQTGQILIQHAVLQTRVQLTWEQTGIQSTQRKMVSTKFTRTKKLTYQSNGLEILQKLRLTKQTRIFKLSLPKLLQLDSVAMNCSLVSNSTSITAPSILLMAKDTIWKCIQSMLPKKLSTMFNMLLWALFLIHQIQMWISQRNKRRLLMNSSIH